MMINTGNLTHVFITLDIVYDFNYQRAGLTHAGGVYCLYNNISTARYIT